jgi:twitching motility protein PilT
MTVEYVEYLCYSILSDSQIKQLFEQRELDLAYSIPGFSRFRCNYLFQMGKIGSVFRTIPFEIKSVEELGLPQSVLNFCKLPRGLVLVTGPTGSGKSTTLAALIDYINANRHLHIITVEDPIEFLHQDKSSAVNQRELGCDTLSFADALKHVLRQNPDVILVGELRDLETIQLAVTAAETGTLVFATLHTIDAAQTIDRMVDVFPPDEQDQIRIQLSTSLQGVISQTLVPKKDNNGRAIATEVLVCEHGVKNIIRSGKTHQIYSLIQTGAASGMKLLDQSLKELVSNGTVTFEDALAKTSNPNDFKQGII